MLFASYFLIGNLKHLVKKTSYCHGDSKFEIISIVYSTQEPTVKCTYTFHSMLAKYS